MQRMFFAIAFSILITIPLLAQAAPDPCNPSGQSNTTNGNFVSLACYKGTPLADVYQSNSLPKFLSALFTVALSVGGIIAVIRLVVAGYHYMGSDMWSSKGKAKEIIQDVVFGLLLLLGTYLILYQINPCILNLDILQGFRGGQTCNYASS
ncbi:MAG TPA: hypothetical protein VI483_00830 [Candidatus Paceibacterota bacterium]